MAARLNPQHDQRTREKIQTSQLVNRLMDHANGKVELTPTQVRAAEILLRKTLPDLSATELSGDVTTRKVVSGEPMAEDEWEQRYGDSLEAAGGASESTH